MHTPLFVGMRQATCMYVIRFLVPVILNRLMGCVAFILLVVCVFGYVATRGDALNVKHFDAKRSRPSVPAAARKNPVHRNIPGKLSPEKMGEYTVAADLTTSKLGASERLQKVIARAGVSSRRTAENLILDGRVSVNGNLVTELGSKINARKDKVCIDGKPVKVPEISDTHWVALNKPKSVITTMRDEANRETVLDLVPKASELRLVPVGGMDRDFTGIMVLTNEVGWIHSLTHPSHPHMNKYEVVVSGIPTEDDVEKLKRGITLEGDQRVSALESISIVDVDTRAGMSILSVKADERSTNQIERLLESINCPVVGLKRTEYHGLKLKGLKKGQWRELSAQEIQSLKESCSNEPKVFHKTDFRASSVEESRKLPYKTAAAGRRPSWAERRSSRLGSAATFEKAAPIHSTRDSDRRSH